MSSIDTLFRGMRSATSGLRAERARMDVIAENLANSQVTSTPEGGPYRRKVVSFEALVSDGPDGNPTVSGVASARVTRDMTTDFETVNIPGHPDADASGMVRMPNVNAVSELADMITAMRAYEANLTSAEGYVRMAQRALELAR
ncbi:flagellar basal body rod protein FlgC [Engelhardtia mirabilis]|uniref:Flagellar basal-body rod protein FlgC n=1 Tax=Engelhardtia mirabilis TaxID=2528011 RepID=A0A518BSS7_9BACT|nr:Flagellar basal-body rod protein FlgC [Planctomycetes bacterium Pla133]QDV04349.1 Flagellar basal-body rod protein FlgC [Planctomycetes bacterium Pla86]